MALIHENGMVSLFRSEGVMYGGRYGSYGALPVMKLYDGVLELGDLTCLALL